MLQSDMSVGECWPMNGDKGFALVELREPIAPTEVSIEHVSRSILPDDKSMPKQITVKVCVHCARFVVLMLLEHRVWMRR